MCPVPELYCCFAYDAASALLQRARGMLPDVHTYTSLISGCGFARDPATARELVSF